MVKQNDVSNDILLTLLYFLVMTVSYVSVVISLGLSLAIFGLVRLIAVYLIRLEHKDVQFLSGLDVLFTNGKTSLEKCVNTNIYCKGKVDVERIRTRLMNKMVRVHPRLYSYIEQKYGYKFWMAEENFQIEDHVIWHQDLNIKDKEQLQRTVRKFHAAQLPYKSSPWHIHIVELKYKLPEAKDEPVFCMIATFHHAIGDGHSILHAFLTAVRDVNISLPTMPEPKRTQKSIPLTILSYVKAIALFPVLFVELLVFQSLNFFDPRKLSGIKAGLTSRDMEVKKIKRIKKAMRTNFTSVLNTCAIGALQKYFHRKQLPIPEKVFNVVAFPLRKSNESQTELVNNFVIFPIGTPMFDYSTPKDRIKISKAAWSSDSNFGWFLFFDFLVRVITPLTPAALGEIMFQKLTMTSIISVAGHGANEFSIFDNGTSMFKLELNVNLLPTIGIGLNFFTQGEHIDVTLNMDTNLADEREIQTILNDINQELLELDKAIH